MFTYVLYHATSKNEEFIIDNKDMWFAHNEKNAKKYGNKVLKFKLIKPLKLIDITNQIFHMDFTAKVNNEKFQDLDTSKFEALVYLGLPDLNSQLSLIGYQKDGLYPSNTTNSSENKILEMINTFSPLFGNKHRYSSLTSSYSDRVFVKTLNRLYPEFDGYISKNYWPSYHHGGFLIPETCLFKPLNCIVEDKTISGGTKNKNKTAKKPGTRPNKYGGVFLNVEQYCIDSGINFDDIIKVNRLICD
jgi:hypothetical protein